MAGTSRLKAQNAGNAPKIADNTLQLNQSQTRYAKAAPVGKRGKQGVLFPFLGMEFLPIIGILLSLLAIVFAIKNNIEYERENKREREQFEREFQNIQHRIEQLKQ